MLSVMKNVKAPPKNARKNPPQKSVAVKRQVAKKLPAKKLPVKPLVIFGNGIVSLICQYFFEKHLKRTVAAHTVEQQWLNGEDYYNKPIYALDKISQKARPAQHDFFIGVGYSSENKLRASKVATMKKLGYKPASLISPTARIHPSAKIGEHFMLLERGTIEADCVIGHNVMIQSGVTIGKGTIIGDNAYIGDNVSIGANSKIGANSTLVRNITLPAKSKISAKSTHWPEKEARELPAHPVQKLLAEYIALKNEGTVKKYQAYINSYKTLMPTLPLWLACNLYQTIWALTRSSLLNKQSYIYEGLFAEMRGIKSALGQRIQAAAKKSLPQKDKAKAKTVPDNPERVLFYLPYAWQGQSIIGDIAQKFKIIKASNPKCKFMLIVGDDFCPSSESVIEHIAELWRQQFDVLSAMPPQLPASNAFADSNKIEFTKLGLDVQYVVTDKAISYERRIIEMQRCVDKFKPDIVMTFSIESILDQLFVGHYPMMRFGLGELIPIFSSDGDLLITPFIVNELKPLLKYHGLSNDAANYRHVHFPLNLVDFRAKRRSNYGFAPDKFILLSVSRHFDVGVYADVVKEVRQFLDKTPDAVWYLVGHHDGATPELLNHKQIHLLPPSNDVDGMLGVADTYIVCTPGGGFTVATALSIGLPVLANYDRPTPYANDKAKLATDIGTIIGKKLALQNSANFKTELNKLYNDAHYRRQRGRDMQLRLQDVDKERQDIVGQQLASMKDAVKNFKRRYG